LGESGHDESDGVDELARLRGQVASLTDQLAESLAREARLAADLKLFRRGLDVLSDSVNIRGPDHRNLYANPVALSWMNVERVEDIDVAAQRWRYLHEDGREFKVEEVPTWRAIHEEGPGPHKCVALHIDDRSGVQRWLHGEATPVHDERGALLGVINTVRDITEERANERALAAQTEALRQRDLERQELIARLEEMVLELSAPALEVWDQILVVPVVGAIDQGRGRELLESTLRAVTQRSSRVVIIDLTGARIDSATSAEQLGRLVRALDLLGARSVLAGISPALACFLVEQDRTPKDLETHGSLRYALRAAIDRGKRECAGPLPRSARRRAKP
jgi:rsbT co-antagonist protein RsbR